MALYASSPVRMDTPDLSPGAHVPRILHDIRADLQALTAAQFGNLWADLSAPVAAGVPRKYLGDEGVNAAAIFVFDWVIYAYAGPAAQTRAAQLSLAAMWIQDNPDYAVSPPWDPSVNVPGSVPANP